MKGKIMTKNNCQDCEGLGYFTEVISTGLSDPNDPYHEPHTERCDTCKIFEDDEKAHHHLMATSWSYAIKEHIKTGLESPTPYKVIPYKNGIGIKKIEFIKPIK